MPAPVPSAQNVLPKRVCRGGAAAPSCRLLRLPRSGIFNIVSFPCRAGRVAPYTWPEHPEQALAAAKRTDAVFARMYCFHTWGVVQRRGVSPLAPDRAVASWMAAVKNLLRQ